MNYALCVTGSYVENTQKKIFHSRLLMLRGVRRKIAHDRVFATTDIKLFTLLTPRRFSHQRDVANVLTTNRRTFLLML